MAHPLGFALQVLRASNANQGMMLAGAIAYYALLALVPLLILSSIALSHWLDLSELLAALGRYLEWLLPSQSKAVLMDVNVLLDNRVTIGALLLVTMLFFSSLAIGILEKAMGQIFAHRGLVFDATGLSQPCGRTVPCWRWSLPNTGDWNGVEASSAASRARRLQLDDGRV